MSILAQKSPNKKVQVYGFFPVDRANCDCKEMIKKWKLKLAELSDTQRRELIEKTKFLECPRDKTGMKRYEISCSGCGDLVGYCWATDPTLTHWCDFHYVQWVQGRKIRNKDDYAWEWRGCFTPHVSPVTEQLCIECCCGQDTRDFRANMTLPAGSAMAIENENRKGRAFNRLDSKFKVSLVEAKMLPFNMDNV